jgi:hypothetical protein
MGSTDSTQSDLHDISTTESTRGWVCVFGRFMRRLRSDSSPRCTNNRELGFNGNASRLNNIEGPVLKARVGAREPAFAS